MTSYIFPSLPPDVLAQTSLHLDRALSDFRMHWRSFASAAPERDGRIAARYSHSAVVHGHSMYLFGGGTFESTNFNDLWRFDLSTRAYIRPLSTGSYPPPKSCATFLSHNQKLILFGGWRHNSNSWPQRECVLYNQLHVYDVPANKWTLISGGQSDQLEESADEPPTLARHSASIANGEMVVFGGVKTYAVAMTISNEVWRLDLNTYKWQRQRTNTDVQPQPRYGQAQVQLDENNILIVGGCGGPNNIFRDAWLLTRPPKDGQSSRSGGGVWTWKQVNVKASLKSGPSPTAHVWCNPACLVGDKLVVLGPIRANDFQMVRETSQRNDQQQQQQRGAPNDNNFLRPASPPLAGLRRPDGVVNVAPPVHGGVAVAVGEHHQMVQEFNNRAEEERHRLEVEHENILLRMRRFSRRNQVDVAVGNAGAGGLANGLNMPWGRRSAAVRLAAFQDEANNNNNNNQQQERERNSPRLQEAHQLLVRGVNRRLNEAGGLGNGWNGVLQPPRTPPAAAAKRKVNRSKLMAVHVCDLSQVLEKEPVITWQDPPANLGCFEGAPENVIMYSLVVGTGELIMFGGLVKEPNSQEVEDVSKVSNGLHFLSVPKRVI